jgi:MFS family permease
VAATICRLIGYVLFVPWGGAIADRYPRRNVLLSGDLLRLGLMGALAGVVAASGPVVAVLALTALASAAGSAERPAALLRIDGNALLDALQAEPGLRLALEASSTAPGIVVSAEEDAGDPGIALR